MSACYLYGGAPAKVQPAAGVKGVLIRTYDGTIAFRVYRDQDDFTDYAIRHADLSVTVDAAELAAFYYKGDGCNVLDHGPEVLGLERVNEW